MTNNLTVNKGACSSTLHNLQTHFPARVREMALDVKRMILTEVYSLVNDMYCSIT